MLWRFQSEINSRETGISIPRRDTVLSVLKNIGHVLWNLQTVVLCFALTGVYYQVPVMCFINLYSPGLSRGLGEIRKHHNYVIMKAMASQITSLTIVYSSVYLAQIKENINAPRHWAFVRGIHRWPVNSPHRGPVTRKMLPFYDVIMTGLVKLILIDMGNVDLYQILTKHRVCRVCIFMKWSL